MNGLTGRRRVVLTGLLLCVLPNYFLAQSAGSNTQENLFVQGVPSVELSKQTVIDGVALLSQTTNHVAFAIEFPLGKTISVSAPALRKFDASIAGGTLTGSLNTLCNLDSTFSWQGISHTINMFPRALAKDPTYLLSKAIDVLELKGVADVQGAVFAVVDQAPGQKQQIAVLQSGRSLRFSKPWHASFKNISERRSIGLLSKLALRQDGSSPARQIFESSHFMTVFPRKLLTEFRAAAHNYRC